MLSGKIQSLEANIDKTSTQITEVSQSSGESGRGGRRRGGRTGKLVTTSISFILPHVTSPSLIILQVVASANLDPTEVGGMRETLDNVLIERNNMIKELQYMETRAAKVSEHMVATL